MIRTRKFDAVRFFLLTLGKHLNRSLYSIVTVTFVSFLDKCKPHFTQQIIGEIYPW